MQQVRRISVGVLAGAVSLSMVGAAAAAPSKHTVSLTGGKSPFAQSLNIVAGSSTAVVYETGPSWQRGPSGNVALLAKSASGKVHSLALGKGKTVQSYSSYTIAKDILVALDSASSSVAWWNVTSGSHGEKKLPTGYTLEGASADGWLLDNYTTSALYDQVAAGNHKPKSLGVPFAKSTYKNIESATPGSTGVALHGYSDMVYLKWGTKSFKKLNINLTKNSISSCTSLAGGALGCYGTPTGKIGAYIYRIPLTGKPAVSTKVVGKYPYPANISVSASATAWTVRNFATDVTNFYSANTKGHGVKTSKSAKPPAGYNQPNTAVAAFGKFVVVTGTTRSLHLATVADAGSKPRSTVTAALGNVHAASISLSGNRVAYTDDQKNYNAGDVWSRNLKGSSAGGAARLISTTATSDGLSISGNTTADSETATSVGGKAHVLIKVGSRIGSVVGSLAQADGDDVLYENASDKWDVYDGDNRKSTAVDLPTGATNPYLSGGYVLYVEADGSVWRNSLKAGSPRMLVSAPSGYTTTLGLFASGSYVAWSQYVNDVPVVSYCQITSSTCTVKTAPANTQLAAATTNGVLLTTETTVGSSSPTYRYTWKLQPYSGGSAKQVLSQTYTPAELGSTPVDDPLYAQVAVANGRVAWIDPSGGAHIGGLPF